MESRARVAYTYSGKRNYRLYHLATIILFAIACNLAAMRAVTAQETVAPPRFVPPAAGATEAVRPLSIRFVTSDDFPPFNFLDGAGRLTGYNVELARAICARLQAPCTVQVRSFPLLVDAVASNEADAIIAGLKDTPRLRAFVVHTLPYLRLPARFAMARDTGVTPVPETMAGRPVAVVRGTRFADYLHDFFPETSRVETGTLPEALSALAGGEVEAVFAGALPLVFWLSGPEGSACCALAGGAYTEPAYFGRGLSIAVSKDNAPLRQALDDALRALEADGVMADLYLRFFPAGLY
ncbi:MAG TPA: transporter substrate-binding domain-containing protein [Methylomirabilota bacterium]|nr:transporter substrate-binding domain-containing protein [Methylomirabilota bacterium]